MGPGSAARGPGTAPATACAAALLACTAGSVRVLEDMSQGRLQVWTAEAVLLACPGTERPPLQRAQGIGWCLPSQTHFMVVQA